MYGHEGMIWGFGGLWMIFFWIVIIIGIIFLVKWLVGQGRPEGMTAPREESSLDILKKRYARGEIDKREFEQKKKDLTGS